MRELFEAKRALIEFLLKHPELREMQEEIEAELNKAGCQQNRLIVMTDIIVNYMEEHAKKLRSL